MLRSIGVKPLVAALVHFPRSDIQAAPFPDSFAADSALAAGNMADSAQLQHYKPEAVHCSPDKPYCCRLQLHSSASPA